MSPKVSDQPHNHHRNSFSQQSSGRVGNYDYIIHGASAHGIKIGFPARLSFAKEPSLGILGLYSFFKVSNSNTNFANLLDSISLGMLVGKISLIG